MSERFSKTQLRLGLVPKGNKSDDDSASPQDDSAPTRTGETLGAQEEEILFRQPKRENLIARLLGLFSKD